MSVELYCPFFSPCLTLFLSLPLFHLFPPRILLSHLYLSLPPSLLSFLSALA